MTTSSRWRAALASAATAAVLVATPLVGASPAHAQYPPSPPSIGLSATTVPAGGTITVNATGFAGGQEVTASILSREVVVGEYYANADGAVSATVTIPSYIAPGPHVFRLVARDPDLILTANFTVTGTAGRPGPPESGGYGGHKHRPPYLADTGSDGTTLMLSAGAAGLVALGAGTMVVMRRRTRT